MRESAPDLWRAKGAPYVLARPLLVNQGEVVLRQASAAVDGVHESERQNEVAQLGADARAPFGIAGQRDYKYRPRLATVGVTVLPMVRRAQGHGAIRGNEFRLRQADAGEFRRKQSGRIVAGFGAAAKTVTLLATCESDLDIICVADNATSKIGRYLPIFSVPIVSPEVMMAHDPDAIVLFAWNLAEEIVPTLPGREIWAPFPRFRRLA